jgi:hypothetical protein
VIYDDLQDDVLSGKLSYMYRRKPDNFMLIPADTLTLKTMLNAFPSDKDFGPMGDINPIPEIYTNFLKTLSSGFESFADGYTSEGGQKKNIDFWESYFNAANLERRLRKTLRMHSKHILGFTEIFKLANLFLINFFY